MACEQFRSSNFRGAKLALIQECQQVVDLYQNQGLRLTSRQLYYQLVTKNVVTNEEKSYKRVCATVADARYAGMIDWDAIEDRGRVPEIPSEWTSIASLVRGALGAWRLPRWAGQSNYVELWVEKQALAGVLSPLADEYHVTLMVNKGYSSASAMKESAERFIRKATNQPIQGGLTDEDDNEIELSDDTRDCILLYLGDHDPSGEDMVRDINDRLSEFGAAVDVRKIALTYAQVRQYRPPPNPAKMTDVRSPAYVKKFGRQSWEVDALPPNVLVQVIRDNIDPLIDQSILDAVKRKEERDAKTLEVAAKRI